MICRRHHSTTQQPQFEESWCSTGFLFFFPPQEPKCPEYEKECETWSHNNSVTPTTLQGIGSGPSLLCFCLVYKYTSLIDVRTYEYCAILNGEQADTNLECPTVVTGIQSLKCPTNECTHSNRYLLLCITVNRDSRTAAKSHRDIPRNRSLCGFHFQAVVGCSSQPSFRTPVKHFPRARPPSRSAHS